MITNEEVERVAKALGWMEGSQGDLDAVASAVALLRSLLAERDALAAAMPSEGADATIGYAHMKAERDEAIKHAEALYLDLPVEKRMAVQRDFRAWMEERK